MKSLKDRWLLAKKNIELPDIVFILLRMIVFISGFVWLYLSHLAPQEFSAVLKIYLFSLCYTVLIYILLFFKPREQERRKIYSLALIFDLIFLSLLVKNTGGFESNFFIGYYLLSALHSFYYGIYSGIIVAIASSVLYLFSGGFNFTVIREVDYLLRVSFLFLISVSVGLLSRERECDKERIMSLACELEKSLYHLDRSQKKLVEAEKLAALGRLTADVAHEIRNPLTSVGGFARRLLKYSGDIAKVREYAEIILSEVRKLEKTLRDVLIFSRKASLHLEPEQTEDVIEDFLKEFEAILSERPNIILKKDYNTALTKVLMDKEQVKIVLYNLLINAMDAMPKGGTLTLRTRTGTMDNENYVIVDVSDAGAGIPIEHLDKIFEPFYTTKEIGVGTGLGLSICKKVIEEHCGLIIAESKFGFGCTFSFYLPSPS